MLNNINRSAAGLLSAAVLVFCLGLTGCGKAIPPVVPMTATVKTADGQPVNNVLVRFVPQLDHLDGNYIASGVTDDNGVCEIKLPTKEESGCCACWHKVVVVEGPVPDSVRENYMKDAGASMKVFEKTLKHRPIPRDYTKLFSTPLAVEVSETTSEFEIVFK